ncbi:MAG: hypothetical protein AAB664_02650 [Patescibacteria group bacterium]
MRFVRHTQLPEVAFLLDNKDHHTYWKFEPRGSDRVTLTCVGCCKKEHIDMISRKAKKKGILFICVRMHRDPSYHSLVQRTIEHEGLVFMDGDALFEILFTREKDLLSEIGKLCKE